MNRPNHYKSLGIPENATQDQIKKAFRDAVRRLHPDVNPSPNAKEEFIRIQESYQVLSDPERRKHYDALLAMDRQRQPQPRPNPAPKPAEVDVRKLTQEAELAFVKGRLRDALNLARQIVKRYPRNGKAHMIIGDVYRMQGQIEEALNAYTLAIQCEPFNRELQERFERLARSRPKEPAASRIVIHERGGFLQRMGLPPDAARYAAQAVGWSGVLGTVLMANLMPGRENGALPLISAWSPNLALFLLLGGLLTGLLLSASGWISPIDHVLPWDRRRLSAGAGLALCAALCFPVSVVAYTVLGLLQNAFNQSLNRIYYAVACLTLAFAIAYPGSTIQTFLFGGNVIFAGLLAGWWFADAARRA